MIRNLKVLGLALVAVFAMSAMMASTAGANFTTTAGASLKGEDTGNVKLVVTGQEITCTTGIFTGTAPAASFEAVKVNAEYAGCKTALGTTVTVTGFGQHGESGKCNFELKSSGKADLECPAGQEVTVDAGPCVVHIPAQNDVGTIDYTTGLLSNGVHDLTLDITIGGITANHTDGFLCPFGSSGHATGAELLGPITVRASVGPVDVDITNP